MTAELIKGVEVAKRVRAGLADHAADLRVRYGLVPGLAVVLVGENPASQVYVRNKVRACEESGFRSYHEILPETATEEELLALIAELNANPQVHGILVQLPLPPHISERAIINAIDPTKDVDGFHPVNMGRLATGLMCLAPCTPMGCVMLIHEVLPNFAGQRALIIGRSNIVGKPLALMMLQENATVTVAHSQTRDLPDLCRGADILIAATGRAGMVRGDWIKPGAIVIDVGITRLPPDPATGKTKLVGDVAFDEAVEVASHITPVPGGVGPMTIACLLQNTLQATMIQTGWG
jgi:methylenetetrahydrofolate dehydrogenase (NADP+)/methenyltetrahydrofolate cyclohydrolase